MTEEQKVIWLKRRGEQQAERELAERLCPSPPPKSQSQTEEELHETIADLQAEIEELTEKLDEALDQLAKEKRAHTMDVDDAAHEIRKLKRLLGMEQTHDDE